ncbi:hypothetical protein GF352_04040 [archaeon]|nr:hypothetical protein [archaeon]
MGFIRLFVESTKPKVMIQKNLFYFLCGYFVSIFYYQAFNIFKLILGVGIFISVYSCVYVINDIFDYKRDRKHPIKRHRPIPSNKLNPKHALLTCALIYITGFLASIIFMNPLFALCIFLLIVGNVVYSHPFFKTKKKIISAGLILALLQYVKLLAGWSIIAGELTHPVIYFMIPACLYLYSLLQVAMHSDHYKGRFKIKRREKIIGHTLMLLPAVLITVLLFTDLVFYITFTILPIYFAFLWMVKKLKLKDAVLRINKYMTFINSLLISLNAFFFIGVLGL